MNESAQPEFFDREHEQPQDWDKLAAYLEKQGHSLTMDPPPRQFTGGFGNLNYLVEIDGEKWVLRRPPMGELPPGANDMSREHKVLSGLNPLFPLAPKPLLFCGDEEVLGRPFFIMEYRPGLVVRKEVPDVLKDKTRDLSTMLMDVLAEFQEVDPAEAKLDDLGKPEGFLDRAVAGWLKRYSVAAKDVYTEDNEPKSAKEVIDWLQQQKPPQGETTLLHNDYKLDNIILNPENPTEPLAVLDWDMCTRGDPLFDFATTLSYWIQPSDPEYMHEVGQMPTARTPGWMTREEVVDYYTKKTGRDLSNFHFYRVLTAFKLGVIFLQIYARYCRGTTTDPRIKALGPTTDHIFDFSNEILKGRVF